MTAYTRHLEQKVERLEAQVAVLRERLRYSAELAHVSPAHLMPGDKTPFETCRLYDCRRVREALEQTDEQATREGEATE